MKICHLLVIKEGEESQEDSLKIRSDENFLEAWLWILRSFLLDFHFSRDSELRKCLNSQTWQTGWTTKIMCRWWKFHQKTKKLNMDSYDKIFMWDHEETCFIQFWYVFHEIWVKMCFCNVWWKSLSRGIR